jgi:pimeloyl-ACP methyl ester carboxylesterase
MNVLALNPGSGTLRYKLLAMPPGGGREADEPVLMDGNIDHVHGGATVEAAERPEAVGAVVSRGGRPDLAGEIALGRVRAPTLLIVGGADTPVIALNRQAMARMAVPVSLEIVPGASHLFEEPGALEQVARLAREWFERFLMPADAIRPEAGP